MDLVEKSESEKRRGKLLLAKASKPLYYLKYNMKSGKEAEIILKQYILQTKASNNRHSSSSGKYKDSSGHLQETFML